jgi:uncharacterized membrane protein
VVILSRVINMTTIVDPKKDNKPATVEIGIKNFRENVRKLVRDAIRIPLDEELQKASQELQEEQRKAIRQILEEDKVAIRQVANEEKKAIWEKAEVLRQSIFKFGL